MGRESTIERFLGHLSRVELELLMAEVRQNSYHMKAVKVRKILQETTKELPLKVYHGHYCCLHRQSLSSCELSVRCGGLS